MMPSCQIIVGDALERLRELPSDSVQCCVTSPPYYGLRDYGTATWEGGDAACDHSNEKRGGRFANPVSDKQASNNGSGVASRWDCPCGAKRIDSQIGLENTPNEYIAHIVALGREIRRVLRPDGTFWLNLGDSYYNYRPGLGQRQSKQSIAGQKFPEVENCPKRGLKIEGFKEKDRMMIPARVAIALWEDGWYLRDEIIWNKLNPMVESTPDRCTKAHEFIYMLTKKPHYYYNQDAIKEPYTEPMNHWGGEKLVANGNSTWDAGTGQQTYRDRNMRPDATGRHKRSVWTVATRPYPEAHFATYPPDLIKPCILAGSRVGDTILDPFAGSGTTGMAAIDLGRNSILIELNPKYAELCKQRTNITPCLNFD